MPASNAKAFSEPIPTKVSLLKWGAGVGKLYNIVSKPAVSTTFPIPAIGPGDPPALGGSVTVTVNGDEFTCTLAAQAYDGSQNSQRTRRSGSGV